MTFNKKKLIRLAPFFSIIFIFAIDFYLIVSIHLHWNESMNKFLPLRTEIVSLRSDVAEAHLWLEEAIAGDTEVDVEEDVFLPLAHESFKLYFAGAGATLGVECDCVAVLEKLSRHLEDFEAMAKQRWLMRDAKNSSSVYDAEFDTKFLKITNIIDSMNFEISKKIKDEIASRNDYFYLIIFFLIAMNVLIIAIVFYLSMKREKKLQKALLIKAHYDSLTGLANRELFTDRLTQSINISQRYETKLAVIFIDLDKFKPINDTLGHHIGDGVLKEIATRLKAIIRKTDTVARLGGDEFTIILNDIPDEDFVKKMISKLMHITQEAMIIQEHSVRITMSMGVAIFPEDGTSYESLVKNADIAMYNAKDSSKNSYKFFHE